MDWTIEFMRQSEKQLANLGFEAQKQIYEFLIKLKTSEHHRKKVKYLKGSLHNLCRYRVGDYRIICKYDNNKLIITVIEIGHRKDIYKVN